MFIIIRLFDLNALKLMLYSPSLIVSASGFSTSGISTSGFSTSGFSASGFSTSGFSTSGFSASWFSTSSLFPLHFNLFQVYLVQIKVVHHAFAYNFLMPFR